MLTHSPSFRPFALFLACVAGLLPIAAGSALAVEAPEPLALIGVNVVPMDEPRVIEDQTVVIRGRRIVAIGPADGAQLDDDVRKLEADGLYLMPGLIEMHGHLPPPGASPENVERELLLYVANGVTTVRGMLGYPESLELRDQVARGERLGPRIFTAGPSLNGNSVKSIDDAFRAVTEQKASGYDLLKIHPGLSKELFDAIADAAEAESIPFAGHIPLDVGLQHALDRGLATVEHLDGMVEMLIHDDGPDRRTSALFGVNLGDDVDRSKIPGVISALQKSGAALVPTQCLMENILENDLETAAKRPELRFVPTASVTQWNQQIRGLKSQLGRDGEYYRRYLDLRLELISEAHKAGVPVLLGADSPQIYNVPGFATVQELEYLVAAGLSPFDAIRAGTSLAADHLGGARSFGRVAVGHRADLVLLRSNPLDDVAHVRQIAGVVVSGRHLSADEISELLEAAALHPQPED